MLDSFSSPEEGIEVAYTKRRGRLPRTVVVQVFTTGSLFALEVMEGQHIWAVSHGSAKVRSPHDPDQREGSRKRLESREDSNRWKLPSRIYF